MTDQQNRIQLIVLDIDNTLFDWVQYYTESFSALLGALTRLTGIESCQLASEAKEVFTEEGSIEYPFVIQRLPSILRYYKGDWHRLLNEAVIQGRDAFNSKVSKNLRPYPGVKEALNAISKNSPNQPMVALTDAPRYVAMWKLNKLGLLHYFDAVYGLADPSLPVSCDHKHILVAEEILVKHHLKSNFGFSGKIRTLPDEYEKPGVRGLKTVLMDYEESLGAIDPTRVLWVGDNLAKDVLLGQRLGVRTAWARYGTLISNQAKAELLSFSPEINIRKNVPLDPQNKDSPQADLTLDSFCDLLPYLGSDQNYSPKS